MCGSWSDPRRRSTEDGHEHYGAQEDRGGSALSDRSARRQTEATRKLEISQEQERESLKSQAITFRQSSAWLHEKQGKPVKSASRPRYRLLALTSCARMGRKRFAYHEGA
jgi:hypothetical protein